MELTKVKEQTKGNINKEYVETEGQQKLLRNTLKNEVLTKSKEVKMVADSVKKDLQSQDK